MQAILNGTILADSNETIVVENNHYFPPSSVKMEYMKSTATHSTCIWKGESSYYTIEVEGRENVDAAWYYPQPSEAALKLGIKDYVAFWKGVEVIEGKED
jgi:uncharacterized protein (DUF427 family)